MADRRSRSLRARLRARRVTVIVVTVVVVGGGAAAAWAATRPASTSYRTAFAGPASVVDSLAAIGTIQPVSEATVTFPMSGQVSAVNVTVGQQVNVGDTLATLNTTSMATTVSTDQSAVASAQAKLASDQTSQTSVPSSTTTTPSSFSSSSSSSSKLLKGLSTDQNAVRQAQQQVDADLTLVSAADKQLAATCPAVVQSLTNLAKTQPPTSTSSTPSSTTTTTPTPPSASDVTDCTTLINSASADEAKADNDEHALSAAVANLSTALNQAVAAVGQSTPAPTHSGSGTSSSSARPASADQIAADQASVDAASAQLAAAQQNMSAATLVSPIAGTVADVTITAGQSATANSTTTHVVIVGPGEDEVTTAVSDTEVGKVKPGQPASVIPDGATAPIAGKVTSIGALGSTTSGGSASYPVTISLNPTSQQLFDGATASVSVTLGRAQAAVTVPTSAVATFGGFSVVSKMVDGKPTITRVTLGVVGSTVTQIKTGLKAGDEVMLANISEPMPSSNTNARGFGGGGARFAGGGAAFTGGGAARTGGGGAARGGG